MKKLFSLTLLNFLVLTVLSLCLIAPGPALAEETGIKVLCDGLSVSLDVQPMIINGRVMVPFRALAESLNVQVSWDQAAQTVTAKDRTVSVKLQIDNKTAYHDQDAVLLDTSPVLINGRMLIPLRFFAESFNCQVKWDDQTKIVSITSPPRAMTVIGFYALGSTTASSWTNLFEKPYPDTAKGNTDLITDLALGWFSLDREGNLLTQSRTGWIRPQSWEEVLGAAKNYNLKVEMVVHVTDGDKTITDLLASEPAMTKAVNAITNESRLYDGVDLNFEGLGWNDSGDQLLQVRSRFNKFVELLSRQLKANNRELTLTLHAPNSAYLGYDYQTLGSLSDRIIVMAYDYGPKPEPTDLVTEAVENAAASVPREKLILGISSPSETAESVKTKVGITKLHNLAGVSLWRLGIIPEDMITALRTAISTH